MSEEINDVTKNLMEDLENLWSFIFIVCHEEQIQRIESLFSKKCEE